MSMRRTPALVLAPFLGIAALVHGPGVGAQGLGPVSQPLEVVHDSGRSVPLSPYLAQLVGDADDPGALSGVQFPFVTRHLRSGVLPKDGVRVFDAAWMTETTFVIAADDLSMRWLAFNHEKLVQAHAVGIVVQAGTPAAYQAMQRLAHPMRLAPDSGEWLSERLAAAGAGVYPLMVHTDGRAYQILFQALQGGSPRLVQPGAPGAVEMFQPSLEKADE